MKRILFIAVIYFFCSVAYSAGGLNFLKHGQSGVQVNNFLNSEENNNGSHSGNTTYDSKWQFAGRWDAYLMPSEPGYSSQMPGIGVNAIEVWWKFAPLVLFGTEYQTYKIDGVPFDNITETAEVKEVVVLDDGTEGTRTTTANVVKYSPGSNTMEVKIIWLTAKVVTEPIGPWRFAVIGGYGAWVDVKYSRDGRAYSGTAPETPLFQSVHGEYGIDNSSSSIYGGVRSTQATNTTTNYMDYHNPGGATFYVGWLMGL